LHTLACRESYSHKEYVTMWVVLKGLAH